MVKLELIWLSRSMIRKKVNKIRILRGIELLNYIAKFRRNSCLKKTGKLYSWISYKSMKD